MTKAKTKLLTMKESAFLAKYLAVYGVRNYTELEDLHIGTSPSSKTGDYSDVYVVSPYGRIPWKEVSRISDKEMRSLMLSIEKALTGALKAYLTFNEEHRTVLPGMVAGSRTYDHPLVAAQLKEKQRKNRTSNAKP